MFIEYPDIVTVAQVAQMLGIGKSSAYSLLQTGLIRHLRIGKKYIIPKTAVISFVESMCYNEDQIIGGGLHAVMKGAKL